MKEPESVSSPVTSRTVACKNCVYDDNECCGDEAIVCSILIEMTSLSCRALP